MAFNAGNIRMFAGQRKLRLIFMVESRPLPHLFRMASLAAGDAGNSKLLVVFIDVALVATHENSCILNGNRSSVCLLVTFRAFDDCMFPLQPKF